MDQVQNNPGEEGWSLQRDRDGARLIHELTRAAVSDRYTHMMESTVPFSVFVYVCVTHTHLACMHMGGRERVHRRVGEKREGRGAAGRGGETKENSQPV